MADVTFAMLTTHTQPCHWPWLVHHASKTKLGTKVVNLHELRREILLQEFFDGDIGVTPGASVDLPEGSDANARTQLQLLCRDFPFVRLHRRHCNVNCLYAVTAAEGSIGDLGDCGQRIGRPDLKMANVD